MGPARAFGPGPQELFYRRGLTPNVVLRRRMRLHKLQVLPAFRGLRALLLNPAREFLLPPQLDDRVLFGHLSVRVAGDS